MADKLKRILSGGTEPSDAEKDKVASEHTVPGIMQLFRAIADYTRNSSPGGGALDPGYLASNWNIDPSANNSAQGYLNYYLKGEDGQDDAWGLLNMTDLYQGMEDSPEAQAKREEVRQYASPFERYALANLDSGMTNEDTGFEYQDVDPDFWTKRGAQIEAAKKEVKPSDIYNGSAVTVAPDAAAVLGGSFLTPLLSASMMPQYIIGGEDVANENYGAYGSVFNRNGAASPNAVANYIGKMQDEYKKIQPPSDEDLQNYSLDDLKSPDLNPGLVGGSFTTGEMRENDSDIEGILGDNIGKPAVSGSVIGATPGLGESIPEFTDGGDIIYDSAGNRFKRKEATDAVSQQFLADHGDDGMSYYTNVNSDIFDAYQESVANASANGAAVIPTQYSDLWDFQMNATADEFLQWAQFANTLYGMYNEPQFLNEDGTLNADEIYRFYDQCKATSIVADQFLSPGASADLAGVLFTDYRTAQAAAAWVADMTGLNVADINTLADLLWTSHMLGDIDDNGRMIDQGASVYNNAYDLGYMGESGTEVGDYSVYNPLASGTQYSAQGRMGDEGNAIWNSWQDLGNDRESAYAHQRNLENQLVDSNSDLNYAYLLGNLPNSQNSEEALRELAAIAHYVRGYGYNQ